MSGSNKIYSYFSDVNCPSITTKNPYDCERTALYILKYKAFLENHKILILGCGDGAIEAALCKHCNFNSITLVDFSYQLLDKAKTNIPYANTICCDLRTEISKIQETYDVIYSCSVIQYFSKEEIQRINTYLISILNKNGIIIHFNVPDKKRRFLYRINNTIILNDIKNLNPKFDFVDKYSRWYERNEFILPNTETTFVTPSINWERFDVIIKLL